MRRAGLALLLLAALPATASAQRQVSYKVTIDGEGVYSYDATHEQTHVTYDAHFKWHMEIPILLFDGDKPITQSAENISGTTGTGTLLSAHATFASPSSTEDCAPAGVTFVNPGRLLPDDGLIPSPEPQVGVRTMGGIIFGIGSCTGGSGFSVSGERANDLHTFDTWFSIPRDAIGMGRIIQLVHEEVTDKRCPGNRVGNGNCKLTWDAAITLDKFYDSGPETGGGGNGGGSGGTTKPAAKPRLKLGPASHSKAAVLVSCPADCSGTITATLPRRGHRSAAAGSRVLARSKFSVAAGKTRRVTVRFSRKAQRQIKHAGGVTLKVRTVSAGKATERALSLRMKGGSLQR
jgi:hypothetical protein